MHGFRIPHDNFKLFFRILWDLILGLKSQQILLMFRLLIGFGDKKKLNLANGGVSLLDIQQLRIVAQRKNIDSF